MSRDVRPFNGSFAKNYSQLATEWKEEEEEQKKEK